MANEDPPARNGCNSCQHISNCTTCRYFDLDLRRRGRRIGGLHVALSHVLRRNTPPEQAVDVPVGAYRATGEAFRQHIDRLVQRVLAMTASAPAQGNGPSPSSLPPCNICYEDFNETTRMPLALMCGHIICLHCLRNLPNLECPTCPDGRFISSFTPLFM